MRILFAADISLNWVNKCKTQQEIEEVYRDVSPYIRDADFSIVNMENVFGDAQEHKPIVKIGPNLLRESCFESYVDVLNPTIVNFANNHTGDYGPDLVTEVLNGFRAKGYIVTGAGNNLDEAYQPAYLEKDGIRAAIIGVCENEFGIATDTTPGSAGLTLGRLSNAILEAKANGAHPIVYIHAGNEFNPFPSPQKVDLYRHLIDFGASAVIGMHTHCPQGYEMYHGGAIVYSMGNFYFPRDCATYPATCDPTWFYGYLSSLEIREEGIRLETIPYHFTSDYIEVLKGERLKKFCSYLEKLKAPLQDPSLIQQYFDAWTALRGFDMLRRANYTDEMKDGAPEDVTLLKSVMSCEAHNELARNAANIIFHQRQKEAMRYVSYIQNLQTFEC